MQFPIGLFRPSKHGWAVAGAAMSGGQPISGPPQTADLSTGGWWTCEYDVAILRTAQELGTYRAILGRLNSGVRLVELPLIDALKPWPPGLARPTRRVRFGDGAAFSDGSGWRTDPIAAQLAAPGYMPASPAPPAPPTLAQIQLAAGSVLQGYEHFSVIGPSGRVRLHLIDGIWDVAGDVYTVSFSPPFREDLPAGTPVDFGRPRCTMKVDIASVKQAWPMMEPPFLARPTIKFAESGFEVPTTP